MAQRTGMPDEADIERVAEVFSLLSTASRLRIIGALCGGEMCVNELTQATALPQSTVSQHLSLMFRAGLLARRREGVQVHYSVEPKTREFLCGAVRALVQ